MTGNILWQKPNNTLALTTIYSADTPQDHAQLLLKQGDVPSNWAPVAYDVTWPANNLPIESYVWNGTAIVEASTPPLTPAQQAEAAMAAGIIITSTGTPSIDGTYSIGPASQANVNATVTYILLNNAFPRGQQTLPWATVDGTVHLFPSVAVFKAFATAFADFVAAVAVYADSNGTVGSIPSNQITIA